MTSARPPYEVFEHTADAGIIARGGTMAELFANAATGMFALMADLDRIEEREEREIEVEARDREGLMVNWLTELLYYLDAQELLFRRFEVADIDGDWLRARAFGETIDRARHVLHAGVKGVTRHLLEIAPEDGGYRARILFDI
ncbi:MAG: archease [Dehalococcoidia bacterium]|nr:archease [Dehalococcoidia bacterium]